MSTPNSPCPEDCQEQEYEYTIDLKLNIPICLEPRVFTKGLAVHTSQKIRIRIQPNIQIVPETSGVVPNCTVQLDQDQQQPEIILEGILEQP